MVKIIITGITIVLFFALYFLLRSRNINIWILSYVRQQISKIGEKNFKGLVHVILCFVDHFEPKWEQPIKEIERRRVETWVRKYPALARRHRDGDGKYPQHSWFYAAEEYEPEYLEGFRLLCKEGFGEIELHLHHEKDTSEGVFGKIMEALEKFGRHGAFITEENPQRTAYAFIHGNWALDNSHKHGINCGVNDELTILEKTGCYADFTLPAAPSSCQTKKINSIYYALDDPQKPKSHDTGVDVEVNKSCNGGLLIIQGPLMLDWKRKKYNILPTIENSAISGRNPATRNRIDMWVKRNIHVKGKGDWLFIKVHCHGAQERDEDALLGKGADEMYSYLEEIYNDGKKWKLHYVTARECYNIIKAAEAGMNDDPNEYRDFVIGRYKYQ